MGTGWRCAARAAAVVICVVAAHGATAPVLADGGLAVGAPAATGVEALLRAAPGYDAAVAANLAPGTPVTPIAGPVAAADGSLWYQVDAGGYLPASALVPGAVAAPQPAAADGEPAVGGPSAAPSDSPATETAVPSETPTASETPPTDVPAATEAAAAEVAAPTEPPAEPAAAPADQPPAAAAAADPAPATTASPTETPTPIETAAAPPAVIATAWIVGSEGATCHAEMDLSSADLGTIPEGSAVDVIGQTVGDWQPVLCNGTPGYLRASSIAWQPPTAADVTATPAADAASDGAGRDNKRGGGGNRGGGNGNGDNGASDGGGDSSSGSGQQIANFALQYVGHPYVYAGEGPRAFDCSGFTMFVIQNTLGLDITHDMFVQYDMGKKVDRNDLQPGDLVFFQNTFRRGLSHVGIYIGNGQFVNAENERTGVVVSDLNSDYYSSRWYGAVRYT